VQPLQAKSAITNTIIFSKILTINIDFFVRKVSIFFKIQTLSLSFELKVRQAKVLRVLLDFRFILDLSLIGL
jgi:hypothetical protein